MCSRVPAPPLATTGTPTDSLIAPRDDQIKAGLGAVGVDAVQHDFARAQARPRAVAHSTASSPVALRPPCENTSHRSGATFLASIETTMHWLPNFSAPARIRSGLASAEELMLILSAPARSIVYMSSTERMPPPTVSGMKHWSAARSITSHHGGAAVRAGGDVEEHHFVRALLVVAQRQLDGIADVAQFARFGLAELDAAGDLAVMDVQARNDTFCHHGRDMEPFYVFRRNIFQKATHST